MAGPGEMYSLTVKRLKGSREWVVRLRVGGALKLEYFTDDEEDARTTARVMWKAYDGHTYVTPCPI